MDNIGLDDFYFNHLSIDDSQKVRAAIFMFTDLFGLTRFEKNTIVRFVLTVRKNYRRVPYHNWAHGFAVSNSMYTIIKKTKGTFKQYEVSNIRIQLHVELVHSKRSNSAYSTIFVDRSCC